jgi:hypothetical protein
LTSPPCALPISGLELAPLAVDKHPENYGSLWLPGQPIPVLALMVRNATWRLGRVIRDNVDPAAWDYSAGGRA